MATPEEELKNFNKAGQEFITSIRSMSAALRENAKEMARETGEAREVSAVDSRTALSLGRELAGYTKEMLTDKRAIQKLDDKLNKTRSLAVQVDAEIYELTERQKVATGEELDLLNKRLETLNNINETLDIGISKGEKLKDQLQDIGDVARDFYAIGDALGDIPVIGKFAKSFEAAGKAAADAAAKNLNQSKQLTAALAELRGTIGNLISIFTLSTIVSGISQANERVTNFARNLNITTKQAKELTKNLGALGRGTVGASIADFITAIETVSNELGISAELTEEQLVSFAIMTKRLGLSAQQASNLTEFTAATGQELTKFNTNLIGTVIQQNLATDSAVRYQDVLRDIADAGAATQLTVSKFPGGLAQAAFQARKFGLSMSMLEGSAQSLLDFESSIEAELESELLTGKQLNLERARAAALMGNQATLAQELAKNFGSIEEFQNRSVIAQEAQAQAMGMTRDQLADALIRQKAMTELSFDMSKSFEQNVKDRQQEIKDLREKGKLQDALNLETKLYQEIGETEFGRQQKNLSIAEAQKELMEDIKSAVIDIAGPFTFLADIMKSLSLGASEFFGFITKIGSKMASLGAVITDKLVNPMKNFDNLVKNAKDAGSSLGKAIFKGFKGLGLSALKKIPFLGAIVGIAMGMKRFREGDGIGGFAEILSGLASFFPGAGTAASIAIDTALAGSDMAKITGERRNETSGVEMVAAYATGNNAMIAATAAGYIQTMDKQDKTNKLLERILEKNQDIYMDSNKVGHSMNAAGQKTN